MDNYNLLFISKYGTYHKWFMAVLYHACIALERMCNDNIVSFSLNQFVCSLKKHTKRFPCRCILIQLQPLILILLSIHAIVLRSEKFYLQTLHTLNGNMHLLHRLTKYSSYVAQRTISIVFVQFCLTYCMKQEIYFLEYFIFPDLSSKK